MNLGELVVELCADTAQLEKSLEQAKKKAYEAASSIEKSFEKINLEINVDDDNLVDLNKHLNLKVQHLKEVNKYFSNNPIVVNVDDDSLVDLNKHLNLKVQHLKEVNKYFNSNPIVVNTDVTKLDELEERLGKLSNKTITITVESELSKQLEKSLTDAVQSAVRDAVSESSVASSQQQAQKDSASSSKAQRVDVVASPMRSIIDGAFENVGKRLTKGINSSIEDTIGVSMDDMTRMSGNMLLRYFGVGKKAQSDPKNEQKRIEAIFKDGMDAFIRTHDSRVEKGTRGRRATRSAASDDIGVDFESASRIASSSALRYFGVGRKAQSDPKNEQARVKAIIEDAIKEYSGSSIKQSNSGVISSTFSEINKAFSDSINVTIESVAQNAKLATIRQARQSAKAVTQNSAPGVQNAISGFFDAAESSDKGAVNKYIGEGIASQSKKAVESIFNRLLPNASPVIKDFLKTGVSAKPVEPIAKSSSDILKEAASDLKNAAKALSDAAVSVKSTEPTAKTSKPFVAKTISDPWQDAAPIPKQLPPKANKSPLPPPQQKRELEPIPVNIPEQIKPLFKTIQSEIHKNIDISEGYKNATKSENDLTPLPFIPSSKNTKKSAQVSLDSIEQSLIAINKYFSDEYKRIQAKVKYAISDAGTKEDISAARSEVSNFVSRSKEAISTIDRYVKTGEDAGFSKDINSELSRIHSSGKSSISKNTRSAEKGFLGKLNLADKKLFDQQLKGYVAQAESLGIEVDAGLKKGIQHAAGGVSDAARAMLDDLIKTVKAKMEIQSPSKVMIALGLMIASGLAIGIKKGVVDVSGASDLLTDVVGNGLKNIKSIPSEGIESYDQAIKNAVSSNSETTKKVFDNAKKASKATIPGMILGTAMMGVADTNLVPKSIRTPLRHLGAFYQGTTQVHKLNPQLAREAEIATIFNMMQSAEKGDGYFPDGGVVGMVKHKTLPTLAHTLGGFNYTQTKDGGLQINDVYDWHQDTDTDKNTPFKLPKNLGSKIYKFLESKKWLRGLLGIEENLFGNTKAFTKYNKKTGRELFSFLNTQSGNDFQLGHSVHSELIGGNPYIQTHRLDRKGLDDLTDLAANPYIASKGNFGQFLNHPKIQEYVLGNGQESQQPTGNNNLLGNLFNNAKSAFSKGGGLKEVGINLISSFGQGFLSANGGVLGIVIGFAKGVLGAVKKVFGIASPSKVMESIGLDFGEGFENGAVAALVLANKRIAELILKTVNESATATESEKAKAEHFATTVESQNQRIAKGFRGGKYNDLNAFEAMEILASSTTFGKVMARITGASRAEIPGILQQAKRDVKSSPVTENAVPQPVSPIITPRSFAPNPNARLVLSSSVNSNPDARLVLPNSATPNPDAQLILPSRPSIATRATITQQEVNAQALINKNKDLLVNLNALLNRNMTASLTGFATVLDDLMNAPRSPVVRSLTRQVGARLPVVLPPTVPASLVPKPFKSTTIKPSLPTGLGFFPIPASPAKPPAVTPSPFAPTPPPPADGFLPIRVRTPQNATNQYLQLGKDLVTNLFTAVGDSIRQSTLSGYASLGQVMRNAVNAALFSLADTLKQPLYKGLLSQARSALPWFMKFIPKTMQLIPMLKPLMPIIGGLTLGLGNSIIKNLLNNDVLKPGGFLTKLLSSVTRINLTSLSGGKSHGILDAISKIMNPVPNVIGTAGIGGPLSLAMGLFGPFMNTFSGLLGLDPSTRSNPKNQAPTVERVLQEQTLANRKKAGLSNAKGGQASRELIENLGNTAVDSVLENLNIPMIPTSVIQGMTGRSINKQSGKIADAISSIGVQRSKTEKALERAMKSGTISPERLDALTKAALRRRGVDTTTREAMSREELEKARQDIIGKPLAISENERNLMFAMGDIERSRFKLGVPRAQRRLDYLTAKVLKERGVTFSDYTSMKQSGKLEETRRDLAANPNTTGVVGRLTQAYATNDQEALKGLLMQGLRKAGMSSEQLQNIDPKLLNTATAGLMATLTGLQAKFKEKGFDMGKALAQGFKDSVRNLANAKDDLEYNAKKAIGQANFGDAVGLIFRRMTRGTIATQDQFKEMYNQMGAGVKKALFSNPKEADEMFPNMLQFMGSIATTLAPVTTLFASLSPLFLPLAPIIGGIGAAVSMVMPHISKMLDGIQRVEVLQRRFTFLGGSKAGGEAEFKYAKDVATKMNVPSEVAANSYSQLAIAARGSKMEGQGVKDLFEGITASLSALGISGQDASLVFMAYTQILAKGKLSMEELRQQLGEKFPPAMGVFAKSMGVSVPEMNALVASGSVLSQDVLPNVAKVLNQDYGASAANQAGGLVVALNKLGNVGFEITTIFTDKLGSTLGWFVGTFADGLALFSNTLGALIPLGQAFAIGFAATIAIGLTTIMTKVKPLVVLFGSLQNLLMATFTAVATNMMPMIIGVTADVADNWLGAEKDLIANMMDGVTNAIVATFSTVDSVMRSMSDGNFSFSSVFGGLVQGAEQAGNIIDWLKGVFSGFFKIIPPGFVELLAMVFMFEQGTALMVMALAPAFKGFIGAVTGMFGGAAKAFVGVMTSMKIAAELMMTSMSSAMAASEARIKIFSATMGFLRTALTHVAVAFGILMFSKGDFSNPMGDSLSKTTKELNNGLTEIRANVQKTADSFDKATNSVTKLGGTLADTLPSKGIQLDIRSFWGGGDFKWDDAIKERNKRDSASGSLMDAVGVGALGAAGAGAAFASGISVLSSILNSAVSTAATIAANKALIAGPTAPVSIFGRLAMAVTPLITAIMSPLGLIVVSIGGFIAAIVLATKALDLFAPKLTGKQKQLIADNKLEGYFDLGENARLTNAQQQILKYFEDQKKNIQNLKEFGASQGFTGKPGDFMADIKPLTGEQQNTFNNTPAISKLNQEIKDNNKRRLAAIADKKNSGASPQEIKDLQNSPGFKELENKSKQMRNAVALAAAEFQIGNTPGNQRIDKELDEKIKKKQAEVNKRRAAVSASRNLMAASSTDAFALSMGDGSDAGTIKLEDELKVLEAQKKNQQKLIKASVQRAFNFQEIKNVDKQLINATKKGVELSKALPSDKVRKEQGEVKQLIQQLYKRRQELVDSFGSPLPILEKQLKNLEKYKEQLTLGEVEGIQGALITPAVQETQRQIEELKKQIAGVKPFDVKPVEEMLYTQATNAVKDANIKFERASSANRSKSNLSQSKVYSSAGTSQQIAPELANIQLAGLNDSRTLLEEKLKTNQAALDKIAQVIAVGGTNLAEAQSEYDKLTEDIMKDRESLTQNALETAKARRDMKQALIDQTKQVAEYYRTSVREAQGASIEFEKAKKTLEGSQLQNKLRAALIGAGDNIYTQFIEGIINIISQTTDMEKKRLDEKKQQYDYQNNVDDIKLRASELQRSLPGKIVPFDENKIKDFDEQLKIVQGSVIGINTDVQQVVTSLGQDAVLATNQLNDAFQGLGTTVAEVGTKLDTTLDKLTSTLDSLKVGTNDLSPQNAPNWAAGALDILGQMDNATPGTAPTIPSAPSPATNFASPVKNTTIQDLINYKPTFGQSVMGSRPKGRIHSKVDFDSRAKAGAGAEILASLPGVATGKLWEGNDGAVFVNSVLPSGTKITIEYGHLSVESIKKALGGALEKSVQVQAGQKLGNVLGDHLDFGVKANGRYINPQVFLSNLARGNYGAIANQPPATSKVKSGATVQNANKGESLVRIQRLGEKDEYGLEKLQLAVIKRGKLIDSFIVNSGNPRTQIFGGAGETKAGSKRPFEFGSYTLGKTVPAGNKKKMGNELIRIEPNFETERTAIGFHIDKDRLIDPGSSGCIVFANEAEFNKFKQALKTSGIKNIVFDQAVGAVEVAKVITGKVAQSSNKSIPGTSRITQGGNDLSAEEYAKLTPLGKKLYELRRNPNVLALANAVARAEGTDFRKNSENFGYGMLIGGANVKDFSTHPFVGTGRKPTWIPGINNSSTASGRYQMMNFNASIQAAKKQFGKDAMPDMFKLIDFQGKDQPGFSPGLQDLYFIGSLLQRGVLDDVVAGKIDSSVLNKLAPHYASIGLGNKRSAYSGQGTPQGKHDNFLKFYQQNLGKLNQIVMAGGAVNPDKLQGLVTDAANLNLGAAATRNSTNEMNNEAQRLTDGLQQLLGIYRLLRQTEEAGFSVLSGMKDLNLDFVKTIAEGLSPSGLSSLERFNIAYGELVRSLEKKRESLEKTIRDTQGTVDNKPLLKAAFESALQKFPTAELALKAIKANDKVFEIAVLQNQQAKKMLSDYDASIPKILDAFKGKFGFDEQLRLSGIAIQNEKSGVALLQKQIEQRKLLQQLDPLDTKSARTAELEANIALLNADLDLREKLNNISRQEKTKEISPEDAKKQRNLAQQENAITKENIQLKLEAEKITERTNNANKLLERSQFIQDSFKGVLEARSSVLKAYGLDFRAEKIDKQVAITNQQFDFAKASIQLDDFIRKNEKATGANKLTNEQINELRENLRLTNEYKLDAIKLQFSELASVIKNTTSGFRNGFKEFLLSTKSFGESLADLFNSITKNLIDSLADIASKRMTDSLFGWVAGLFGGKGAGLASGGSFVGDVLPNTSFNMAFAGGMVGELPTFANGGIVGALNKERSLTGRVPHVIIASEGERVLNHKETAIWNKLQGGVAGFANGGVVGAGGNGAIASRMGNTTTINVPVSVAVGSDSEVDTRRLSQAVQAMVSDGIRREMRVGGSINRGNPYGR